MKKIIIALLAISNLVNAQNVKLKGSDSVLPLAQKEAETF